MPTYEFTVIMQTWTYVITCKILYPSILNLHEVRLSLDFNSIAISSFLKNYFNIHYFFYILVKIYDFDAG